MHWQIRSLDLKGSRQEQPIRVGEGEHTQLASFSTRKVSLLMSCLALVHRGDLALNQRLVITESLKDGVRAGIMKDLAPGVELSLEDHLRQMMITSDNICTQLIFEAIAQATGNALQWVNDYCSWVGLKATIHREVFPRSGDLDWHHGIEHMTVTTPADQATLLELLGRATWDAGVADSLCLSRELCRFAITLMRTIYTPLLGASTSTVSFAEKNGRGLRSLSQIGLALDPDGTPGAAVAVFAEQIPTQLPCGRPGRLAAYELFSSIGQFVEHWYLQAPPRITERAQPAPELTTFVTTSLAQGTTTPQHTHAPTTNHPLAGVGKLFAALTIAESAVEDPQLLKAPVTITGEHRRQAEVGPLRTHTGDLTLCVGDAVGLIIGTCDAAAALGLRASLEQRNFDLLAKARSLVERLSHSAPALNQTVIAGYEDPQNATGDLLEGVTSPQDLVRLLAALAEAGGLTGSEASASSSRAQASPVTGIRHAPAHRVLGWMAQVFEPAGLAYGLPGFGPKRVSQWSVSGLELRSDTAGQGWASVLITRPDGAESDTELAVAAAFLAGGAEAEPARGLVFPQAFGDLGLAAYRACGKIGATEYRPRP